MTIIIYWILAEEAAKAGISPIIIDNTNIRIWEFKDYVKIAVKYEYHIEIMEPGLNLNKWVWSENIIVIFFIFKQLLGPAMQVN